MLGIVIKPGRRLLFPELLQSCVSKGDNILHPTQRSANIHKCFGSILIGFG